MTWTQQGLMRRWRLVEKPADPIIIPYWPFFGMVPKAEPEFTKEYQRYRWTKSHGYQWMTVPEDEYYRD